MGMELEPYCSSCNHAWPVASTGDAKSFIGICTKCENVVNVERNGFRRELKPCPMCNESLNASDIVDVFNSKPDQKFKCPRCEDEGVTFKTVAWFSVTEFPTPSKGEIVHATIENGGLEVPGLWLGSGTKIVLHEIPNDVGERTMELETLDILLGEYGIESIEFRFVGFADVSWRE